MKWQQHELTVGTRLRWEPPNPNAPEAQPASDGTITEIKPEWGRLSIRWDDGECAIDLKPGLPAHFWECITVLDGGEAE